jgi:hypothetical protein
MASSGTTSSPEGVRRWSGRVKCRGGEPTGGEPMAMVCGQLLCVVLAVPYFYVGGDVEAEGAEWEQEAHTVQICKFSSTEPPFS